MANRLRNKRIEIRVSETEEKMIRDRMALCNIDNMGKYLRKMAINGYIFKVDYAPIKELTYEIHKIGVNINQIAHKANLTGTIPASEIQLLKEMLETIWQYQKYILSDEP